MKKQKMLFFEKTKRQVFENKGPNGKTNRKRNGKWRFDVG